jgi:general secretion pathway protein N
MRSRKLFIALFVVTFLLALITTLPASLFGAIVSDVSNTRLELANCSGTVWHGTALPILHRRNKSEGIIALSPVQWDISPLHLFTLQLRIKLNWIDENQANPVEIILTKQQVIVRNLILPVPASMLGELSAYLQPIQLDGRIIAKSELIKISSNDIQGTLTADWIGASSALSNVSPLGDYHFVVKGTGSSADVTLDTTKGALILKGSGHLSLSGTVNFTGQAQAAEGQQNKLGELLRNIGPEVQPGQYSFALIAN